MGLLTRLKGWMTFPELAATSHECTDCDVLVPPESSVCPECGGEVTVVEPDLSMYYWEPKD